MIEFVVYVVVVWSMYADSLDKIYLLHYRGNAVHVCTIKMMCPSEGKNILWLNISQVASCWELDFEEWGVQNQNISKYGPKVDVRFHYWNLLLLTLKSCLKYVM